MDYLTNLYKHKCEQLQEQINNMKRRLNEANAPGPTQFPTEWHPPLLAPQDFQVPLEPGYEEDKPINYPVWYHDSDPGPGWDGWWPDAPDDDPRRIPPTEWPRNKPVRIPPTNRPKSNDPPIIIPQWWGQPIQG